MLRAAARERTAAIVVSSDFGELARICNRVVVMRRGRLVAELRAPGIDEHRLTELAYLLRALHERRTRERYREPGGAARLVGLGIPKIVFLGFVVSGAAAGLGGVLLVADSGAGKVMLNRRRLGGGR